MTWVRFAGGSSSLRLEEVQAYIVAMVGLMVRAYRGGGPPAGSTPQRLGVNHTREYLARLRERREGVAAGDQNRPVDGSGEAAFIAYLNEYYPDQHDVHDHMAERFAVGEWRDLPNLYPDGPIPPGPRVENGELVGSQPQLFDEVYYGENYTRGTVERFDPFVDLPPLLNLHDLIWQARRRDRYGGYGVTTVHRLQDVALGFLLIGSERPSDPQFMLQMMRSLEWAVRLGRIALGNGNDLGWMLDLDDVRYLLWVLREAPEFAALIHGPRHGEADQEAARQVLLSPLFRSAFDAFRPTPVQRDPGRPLQRLWALALGINDIWDARRPPDAVDLRQLFAAFRAAGERGLEHVRLEDLRRQWVRLLAQNALALLPDDAVIVLHSSGAPSGPGQTTFFNVFTRDGRARGWFEAYIVEDGDAVRVFPAVRSQGSVPGQTELFVFVEWFATERERSDRPVLVLQRWGQRVPGNQWVAAQRSETLRLALDAVGWTVGNAAPSGQRATLVHPWTSIDPNWAPVDPNSRQPLQVVVQTLGDGRRRWVSGRPANASTEFDVVSPDSGLTVFTLPARTGPDGPGWDREVLGPSDSAPVPGPSPIGSAPGTEAGAAGAGTELPVAGAPAAVPAVVDAAAEAAAAGFLMFGALPASPSDGSSDGSSDVGSVGGGLDEAATPLLAPRLDGEEVGRLELSGVSSDVSAVVGSEAAGRVESVLAKFAHRVAELIVRLAGESNPDVILAEHASWVKDLAVALGAGEVGVGWDPDPEPGRRARFLREEAGVVGGDGVTVGRVLADRGGVADQKRLSVSFVHEVWHPVQLAALRDPDGVAARLLAAAGQWRESLTGPGWESAVQLGKQYRAAVKGGSEAEQRAAFRQLWTVAHERDAETMAMSFGQLLDQALAGAWSRTPQEGPVAEVAAPEEPSPSDLAVSRTDPSTVGAEGDAEAAVLAGPGAWVRVPRQGPVAEVAPPPGSRPGPSDRLDPVDRLDLVDRFDLVDPVDVVGRLGRARAWHGRLDGPVREGLADLGAIGDEALAAWPAVGESIDALEGLAEGGLDVAGVEAVRVGLAGVVDRYRRVFDLSVGLRFGLGWLATPGEFVGAPEVAALGGVAGRVLRWRFRAVLSELYLAGDPRVAGLAAKWGGLVARQREHFDRAWLEEVHRFVHGERERVRALGPAPAAAAGAGVELEVAEAGLRELTVDEAVAEAVPAREGQVYFPGLKPRKDAERGEKVPVDPVAMVDPVARVVGVAPGSRFGAVDRLDLVDQFDLVDPVDGVGRLGRARAWHGRLDGPVQVGLADLGAAGGGALAAWPAVGESIDALAGMVEGGLDVAGVDAVRVGLAEVVDRYRRVFDLLVGLRFGLGWLATPGEFVGAPEVAGLDGVAGRVLRWRFRAVLSELYLVGDPKVAELAARWGELVPGPGEPVGRAKLEQVHRFVHGERERVRVLGTAPAAGAGGALEVAESGLRELSVDEVVVAAAEVLAGSEVPGSGRVYFRGRDGGTDVVAGAKLPVVPGWLVVGVHGDLASGGVQVGDGWASRATLVAAIKQLPVWQQAHVEDEDGGVVAPDVVLASCDAGAAPRWMVEGKDLERSLAEQLRVDLGSRRLLAGTHEVTQFDDGSLRVVADEPARSILYSDNRIDLFGPDLVKAAQIAGTIAASAVRVITDDEISVPERDQADYDDAQPVHTWKKALETEYWTVLSRQIEPAWGEQSDLTEKGGLLSARADGDTHNILELTKVAALLLDSEVDGADPQVTDTVWDEADRSVMQQTDPMTLGELLPKLRVKPEYADVMTERLRDPGSGIVQDDKLHQFNLGVAIETLYPFYQGRTTSRGYSDAEHHIHDGEGLGRWFARLFNGDVAPSLAKPSIAQTAAGYVTDYYSLVAAQAHVHNPREAPKDELTQSPRQALDTMLAGLPDLLQMALEAYRPEIEAELTTVFGEHNQTLLDMLAAERGGAPVDLWHGPLTGRRYTLAEYTRSGLGPSDPKDSITPLESFYVRTFFKELDTNNGNLKHTAGQVVFEDRGHANTASEQWRVIFYQQEQLIRKIFREFEATRTLVGARRAAPIDAPAEAAELRRRAAFVDAGMNPAARLFKRTLEAAAGLMDQLVGEDIRLDLSVLESGRDPLFSDEDWRRVLRAAVQTVHESPLGKTRAWIQSVDASRLSVPEGAEEEFSRWFPNADVETEDGWVLVRVGIVQASDKYTGANSAPHRVDVVALDKRVDELAGVEPGVDVRAALEKLAAEVGIPAGEDAVQTLRDMAYLAAAVYGRAFTTQHLKTTYGVARLAPAVGLSWVAATWQELEAIVGHIRGDDPADPRHVDPGQVRVLFDVMAGLAAGSRTLDGLLEAVAGSDHVAAALRWVAPIDVFTISPDSAERVPRIMARLEEWAGEGGLAGLIRRATRSRTHPDGAQKLWKAAHLAEGIAGPMFDVADVTAVYDVLHSTVEELDFSLHGYVGLEWLTHHLLNDPMRYWTLDPDFATDPHFALLVAIARELNLPGLTLEQLRRQVALIDERIGPAAREFAEVRRARLERKHTVIDETLFTAEEMPLHRVGVAETDRRLFALAERYGGLAGLARHIGLPDGWDATRVLRDLGYLAGLLDGRDFSVANLRTMRRLADIARAAGHRRFDGLLDLAAAVRVVRGEDPDADTDVQVHEVLLVADVVAGFADDPTVSQVWSRMAQAKQTLARLGVLVGPEGLADLAGRVFESPADPGLGADISDLGSVLAFVARIKRARRPLQLSDLEGWDPPAADVALAPTSGAAGSAPAGSAAAGVLTGSGTVSEPSGLMAGALVASAGPAEPGGEDTVGSASSPVRDTGAGPLGRADIARPGNTDLQVNLALTDADPDPIRIRMSRWRTVRGYRICSLRCWPGLVTPTSGRRKLRPVSTTTRCW